MYTNGADEPLSLCGSAHKLIQHLSSSCMHSQSHGATYGNVSVINIIKVVCVVWCWESSKPSPSNFVLCPERKDFLVSNTSLSLIFQMPTHVISFSPYV